MIRGVYEFWSSYISFRRKSWDPLYLNEGVVEMEVAPIFENLLFLS